MIGLDTNVLVRYLTKDDRVQTPSAVKLIRSLSADNPGFVSLVVVVELIWVLDACYRFNRSELLDVLESLLSSSEIQVEAAELIAKAARLFAAGNADFADYLVERSGYAAGCLHTFTFDQKAAASAGMRLLK